MWSQTIGFLGQVLATPPTTTTVTSSEPAGATTTLAALPAPKDPERSADSGAWPWLIAGAIVAVGALIAFVARQRRPRPSGPPTQPEDDPSNAEVTD